MMWWSYSKSFFIKSSVPVSQRCCIPVFYCFSASRPNSNTQLLILHQPIKLSSAGRSIINRKQQCFFRVWITFLISGISDATTGIPAAIFSSKATGESLFFRREYCHIISCQYFLNIWSWALQQKLISQFHVVYSCLADFPWAPRALLMKAKISSLIFGD